MTNLLTVFFCLIPWGHFFFRRMDVWNGQGAFFQAGLLICFAYSFYEPAKYKIKNIPFGLFFLWCGMVTFFWWDRCIIERGVYAYLILMPFLNLFSFVLLYRLITEYLDQKGIEKVLEYFTYSLAALLFYCVLQRLNLDQFYKHFNEGACKYGSQLVGTLGNVSHLAGYLGICLPILYLKRNKVTIISTYILWAVIIMTGSTSGLLAAVAGSVFFILFFNPYTWYDMAILSISGVIYITLKYGTIINMWGTYLNMSGRFEYWKLLYPEFQKVPITGRGMGIIQALNMTNGKTNAIWKVAHCEPYQLAVMTGIIGLCLGIYGVYKYFKVFGKLTENRTAVVLASVFIASLFNSLLNYPYHLFVTGTVCMFAYAGLFTLKEI